jgi:hypothetical protein
MAITEVPDQQQPDDELSFNDFASTMPETAQGFIGEQVPASATDDNGGGVSLLDDTSSSTPGESSSPVDEPRKRVNITKKMKKAMNRLKSKTANVPIMWFHMQAKSNPEWELDEEEKELLQDAVDTVFEVLDIDILIEPLNVTLTSIWWVISYPILAFVFLFLTKKSLTMNKEQAETEIAK